MKNFVDHQSRGNTKRLYQDAMASNGDLSTRTRRNLIATLNTSTYPVQLISHMEMMNVETASALKDFDTRLVQNWDDYSLSDKETLLLLTNDAHDAFLKTIGMRAAGIEFVDEIANEDSEASTLAEYDDTRHVTKVSRKLLARGAVEALTVFQHEQDHGIAHQFRSQYPEMVECYPALAWSQAISTQASDDAQKIYDTLYDHCAEEALVRSAQVNLADMLAPGSNVAKRVREIYLEEPGYHRMAASKQFFSFTKQ